MDAPLSGADLGRGVGAETRMAVTLDTDQTPMMARPGVQSGSARAQDGETDRKRRSNSDLLRARRMNSTAMDWARGEREVLIEGDCEIKQTQGPCLLVSIVSPFQGSQKSEISAGLCSVGFCVSFLSDVCYFR